MQIQVELDIRKPIPTGFLQRMGKGGSWIQLCYERLIEFQYNCGLIGHGKYSCSQPLSHNQITNGDLYGPWLRVEADAFTVISEGSYLRRVEIPQGKIFYTFSSDTNTDLKDG